MSADQLKAQNEQVVTFTLVELLTQLVFIAMLLAVVLRDEERANFADPAAKIARLEQRVAVLERENADLLRAKAYLEDQLRVRPTGYQPSDKLVPVPVEQYGGYLAWVDKEGRGGRDRPACTGLPGFVLALRFAGGGISGSWIGPADYDRTQIPGMAELSSGALLSTTAFRKAAGDADGWARAQAPACGLRVRIDAGAMVDTKKQRLVRQYFYESTQ